MKNQQSSLLEPLALVLLSALLNWLSQPNELFVGGNWFFGLISYIPLYVMFASFPLSIRSSGRLGLLYALINTLSSYFWLTNFGDYSLWTISGVTLVYLIFYRAFFRMMQHLFARSPRPVVSNSSDGDLRVGESKAQTFFSAGESGPLIFAVAWTAFEFFRSRGYLAFPWNLAAFPFHEAVFFNQIAELSGVWIISFAVLYLQAASADLLIMGRGGMRFHLYGPEHRFASAALILLIGAYGLIRMSSFATSDDRGSGEELIVLLVQQNVDSWAQEDRTLGVSRAIDLSMQGIDESAERFGREPDLIAWSETSLTYPYSPEGSYYQHRPRPISLRDFLESSSAELITGAPVIESIQPFTAFNSSIHIDSEGRLLGEYGKIQLIPFAEHVPFTDFKPLADFLEGVVGIPASGWTPGRSVELFTLDKGIKLGTPICFEDSFASNTRYFTRAGADVLLNLTNNAWSETRSAQMQHLVSARYRAIENRRYLLRSTNGGVTSIISPDGTILAEIPMFEEAFLLERIIIPDHRPLTVYARFGDWFAWVMVLLLFGFLVQRKLDLEDKSTG